MSYQEVSIAAEYRGRKMKPGKYLPSPPRIFVKYCDCCHSKVLLELHDMKTFGRYFKRNSKSTKVILLKLAERLLGE